MRIVLLGYMGSGKTTIGKMLAKDMAFSFLDLDEYIEVSEGKSVSEIFKTKGEIYFRKREHEYLKEILAQKDDLVLSTGGGTPCYSDNMTAILHGAYKVFYLKLSINALVQRLAKEKEKRPLINNLSDNQLPEFIGKHLFERSFYYEMANNTIVCDDKKPYDIMESIKTTLV